ncbi:MAG: hypothetical protein SGPRY_009121 [Prymnesium sp.]
MVYRLCKTHGLLLWPHRCLIGFLIHITIGGYEDSELNITTLWFTRKLVNNDTLDYNILPAVPMPVIFGYSRSNVDSFTSYHGPTRGFASIVVISVADPQDLTIIWLISSLVFGLLAVVCGFDYWRRQLVATAYAVHLATLQAKIDNALDSAGKLSFGMVIMSASDFLKHKKFVPHETLRDNFEVKVLVLVS